MDDDEDGPGDLPAGSGGAVWPVVPPLPPEVHEGTEEVRRMVEAGAASPEELRALAAKLRERREMEAALWRQEVKPALIKSKKWRSRNREADAAPPEEQAASNLRIGLAILGAVLVLILAASQGSFLIVLLPVAAVLVVAYRQGTQADAGAIDESTEEPPD